MFLSYYKATNAQEGAVDVTCLIGRSSLTKANKSVKFNNQRLIYDENNDFLAEGTRLLTMCQGQNIFALSNQIDEDISLTSSGILTQLKEFKELNPDQSASLKISIETYLPTHMFFLDWIPKYVSILEEDTKFLVGLTYMKYVLKKGDLVETIEGTYDLIVYP